MTCATTRVSLAAALIVTALAGCLAGPPATPSSTTAASQPTTADETRSHVPPPSDDGLARAVPRSFVWTGCHGMGTGIDLPDGVLRGTSPAGWTPSSGVGGRIDYDLLRCDRISWGTFERGPVHVIIESHGNATWPQSCDLRPRDWAGALESMWFDDRDLAAWVNRSYGIPTFYATINDTTVAATSSEGFETTWTFVVGDQPASTLMTREIIAADRAQTGYSPRLAWSWSGGWSILNLTISYHTSSMGYLPAATGELFPPTLWSQVQIGAAHITNAISYIDADAEGIIRTYGDQECQTRIA